MNPSRFRVPSPGQPSFAHLANASPFAVIDPVSEEYHQVPEPGASSSSSTSSRLLPRPRSASNSNPGYFAISYVWSDWKESPADELPNWNSIRNRLLHLSTTHIASRAASGEDAAVLGGSGLGPMVQEVQTEAFRCWLDCKCIDQSSQSDKAYWVPRMNRVFFNARCTILLLRNLDLTGLYELYRITKCVFADAAAQQAGDGRGRRGDDQPPRHRCLFAPSCISLAAPLSPELEGLCLATLHALWEGSWRKRAWIFQEILLSERYIISWGDSSTIAYMDLEAIGYVAAFLQMRHPHEEPWLRDFWIWCKQCAHLRQFYSDKCDMEATVLQLADNLEASIPCDKYYALCGILGLDNIQYNPQHSPDEALDNLIAGLTKQGRMGWMYAIPASPRQGLMLSSESMAPFVLTKKRTQVSHEIREPFFSSDFFATTAVELGLVNAHEKFEKILDQMGDLNGSFLQLSRVLGQRQNFLRDSYTTASLVCRHFPAILFRLGYEIFSSICEWNILEAIFNALDTSGLNRSLLETDRECCLWFVIVRLCFVPLDEILRIPDMFWAQVVGVSAHNVQALCSKLCEQGWSIIQWQKSSEESRTPDGSEPRLGAYNGTLYPFGKPVWAVQTKRSSNSLLFVAADPQSSPSMSSYPTMFSPVGYGNETKMPFSAFADSSSSSLNLPTFRSEFSDSTLALFGIVFQIHRSPRLMASYSTLCHEAPDDDSQRQSFRQDLKSKLTGSSGSIKAHGNKRARFLNFQRVKESRSLVSSPRSPLSYSASSGPYGLQRLEPAEMDSSSQPRSSSGPIHWAPYPPPGPVQSRPGAPRPGGPLVAHRPPFSSLQAEHQPSTQDAATPGGSGPPSGAHGDPPPDSIMPQLRHLYHFSRQQSHAPSEPPVYQELPAPNFIAELPDTEARPTSPPPLNYVRSEGPPQPEPRRPSGPAGPAGDTLTVDNLRDMFPLLAEDDLVAVLARNPGNNDRVLEECINRHEERRTSAERLDRRWPALRHNSAAATRNAEAASAAAGNPANIRINITNEESLLIDLSDEAGAPIPPMEPTISAPVIAPAYSADLMTLLDEPVPTAEQRGSDSDLDRPRPG